MKPCGCPSACSVRCRNDRAAIRRAARIRREGPSVTVSARRTSWLKPSALRLLGRLLKGPATNRDLMNLGGFGWACRLSELRKVGHEIHCEACGPTPGMRTYFLEARA